MHAVKSDAGSQLSHPWAGEALKEVPSQSILLNCRSAITEEEDDLSELLVNCAGNTDESANVPCECEQGDAVRESPTADTGI